MDRPSRSWPRPGSTVPRLVVIGVGKVKDLKSESWVKLGGVAMGKIPPSAAEATIIADLPGGAPKPERVADMALGIRLRAYSFDRYKTKRKEDDQTPPQVKVSIAVSSVAAGAEGVRVARRDRERRVAGARPRQRAAQCAVSGGIRAPHQQPQEIRRSR